MFRRVRTKWIIWGIICTAAALAVVVLIMIMGTGKKKLPGADYAVGIGFEGLKVKRVIQAFDLKETKGMGGAYYDETVRDAVAHFQETHGLEPTGVTDLKTWKALGFSRDEWDVCSGYRSPSRVNAGSTREEKIEVMIERAYDYLGDPYVIGASGPPGSAYGVDCSGLVMQALYAAGVGMKDINPVTHAQPGHEYESRNLWHSDHFTVVDFDERERGDLIFYCNDGGIVIHIAIYLGDDQVIESWPNEVQISPVIDKRHPEIKGVKRVF